MQFIDFNMEDYQLADLNKCNKSLDIVKNSCVQPYENEEFFYTLITNEEQYEGNSTYFE